jgi:hypothetical protein
MLLGTQKMRRQTFVQMFESWIREYLLDANTKTRIRRREYEDANAKTRMRRLLWRLLKSERRRRKEETETAQTQSVFLEKEQEISSLPPKRHLFPSKQAQANLPRKATATKLSHRLGAALPHQDL